jgi:hypothetical protein
MTAGFAVVDPHEALAVGGESDAGGPDNAGGSGQEVLDELDL